MAERGRYLADGHGNSVPRFHIVWETGPALVEPFAQRVKEHMKNGLVTFLPRHRVDELLTKNGTVVGVSASILKESKIERGQDSNREVVGEFEYYGDTILVSSGGIGANFELIRKNWPKRLGNPPKHMLSGVPKHVDGRMLAITKNRGKNCESGSDVALHGRS